MKIGDMVREKRGTATGYITANTFWGGDSVWVRWIDAGSDGWVETTSGPEEPSRKETQCYKESLELVET